jgi:hemolysin activation/secretion protein
MPGEALGGAVLVIEGRHDLVTGSVTFDNNYAPQLGRTVLGLGLDMNSPTGSGEQVYLRASGWVGSLGSASFFDEYPRNRVLAAGLVVPIGIDGMTLNLEVTDAQTTPKPKANNPQTTSSFTRYALRLRYPVLRTRASSLNLEASFDAQEQTIDIISPANLGLAHDDLRVLRLASDGFLVTDIGGLLTGRVSGSAGVDALGARNVGPAASVPLSRRGVDAEFQKAELAVRYQQPLGDSLVLQLDGRGQTSFGQPLALSEQIILGNSSALSSFYSGTISGDSGYVFRGELQLQRQFPFFETNVAMGLTPYLFAAAGEVFLSEPTAVERRHTSAFSYGLGLRWGATREAWRSNIGASVEYGRRDSSDQRRTEDLLTINVIVRF